MDTKVYIYFSKTGTGYELLGESIISGFDAFILREGSYLIEYSYSDMKQDMHFFIYEWDNSQKKRRTIFEGYQRQRLLLDFANNVDVCDNIKQRIQKDYMEDEEENANA
jgi:hypothetical protein